MWTQRDQIQAYQFVRRRVVSSVLAGDANTPASPNRRPVIAGWLSVVATLLVAAAFTVIGFLHKDTKIDWQAGGQILVQKDSATVYVLGTDRRLHPMVNYTSARLLVGANAKTISVSAKDIDDAPRGVALGIVGAPDSVPSASRLVAGPWTACASRSATSPSAAQALTSLQLGVPAPDQPLQSGTGLLVADPDGRPSLLVAGVRYALATPSVVTALGFATVSPVVVPSAWLSAVRSAGELRTIAVSGAGGRGPVVGSKPTSVGQVLRVRTVSSADQYFVVRPDGLEPVTETVAALVLADPDEQAAYPGTAPAAVDVASSDAAGVAKSAGVMTGNSPAAIPTPLRVGTGNLAVCVSGSGTGTATVTVGSALPDRAAMIEIPQPTALEADAVQVAPGSGSLVLALQSPAASTGTLYLVTDSGVKYPITSADAQAALGYGSATPTPVRSALLALLPTGVALDSAAAQQVVR